MHYCRVYKKNVYSCDHAICNEGTYAEQQGMKYCRVYDELVYSCDHAECNE